MSMGSSGRSRRKAKTALRAVIGLALVLVAGVSIRYLAFPPRRPPTVHPDAKPIAGERVDVKERLNFTRYRDDRIGIEVSALRDVAAADDMRRLEGEVEFVNRGRKGGREIRIASGFVTYDRDWTRFDFESDVIIRLEGVDIRGPRFVYDRDSGIIRSTAPVTFSGRRFQGEGREARYDVAASILRLSNGVTWSARPREDDARVMAASGDTLTFGLDSREGTMSGSVTLVHGRSRGSSESVAFALFAEQDAFRKVEFIGRVVLDLMDDAAAEDVRRPAGTEAGPVAESELIFFQGGRRRIEAGRLILLPFENEPWLHSVMLRESGHLDVFNEAGGRTRLEAGEIDIFYLRDGEIRDFHLRGGASIRGEAEGRERILEGPSILYEGRNRTLRTAGEGAIPARTVSRGREITADAIAIYLQRNDFDARGRVRIVSSPQPGESREAGLFDAERPVYMTAGAATYAHERKRFTLSGRARLWQGRESLEANEIAVLEENGALEASGSVRSILFHRPAGRDLDERVEIRADRAVRDPDTGQVVYTGNGVLTAASIILRAGRMTLEPARDTGLVHRIVADTGRVRIIQGAKEAEGEKAEYDLEPDTIVLTGRPVLREKDRGAVQGEKLTFHLADGRIHVENRDSERSLTIIKS